MGVGRYLGMSLGRFVIGRRQDAGILGTYTMGEEIAAMPSTELLAPLGRVMFPVFAAARDEPAALSRLVGLAQGVQALIVLPACVGIILVAGDAVALLLGPQWAPAVPFVQIIALGNAVMLPGHATGYMLLALGHVRAQSICMWIKLAVLALLVLVLFPGAGALGVANARLAVSVVDVVVVQLVARAIVAGFRPLAFLAQAWRPLVASAVMAGAVLAVAAALAGATATTRLLAEAASGGTAYVLCALLLWRTAGFPAGAETYLLGKLGLRRAGP
jgi:lipopolysaccharide exporter